MFCNMTLLAVISIKLLKRSFVTVSKYMNNNLFLVQYFVSVDSVKKLAFRILHYANIYEEKKTGMNN